MSSDGNRSGSAAARSASRSRSGTPLASGKSNGHARSMSGSPPRPRSHSPSHHSMSQSPVRERSAASRSSGGGREASGSPSRARSRSRDDRRVRRSRSPDDRKRYRSRSRDSRYRRRSRSPSSPPRRRSRSHRRSRSRSPRRISRYSPIRRSRYNDGRDNPEPCSCLGVFGMSLNTTERDLKRIFGEYGEIESVQLVYDRYSGRSRGFGFVYFETTKEAIRAKDHLRDAVIDGMRVRVDFSVTKGAPRYYRGRSARRSRSRSVDSYRRRRSRS